MISPTLAYADVEAALTSVLPALLPSFRFCTELPNNITGLSVVQVDRIGGPRRFTFDHATVDFRCFAPTRATARQVCEQLAVVLEQVLPGTQVPGGSVGAVICTAGPNWVPYGDINVRLIVTTYQINIHAASSQGSGGTWAGPGGWGT